jgi:hypothetical protein
MIWQRVRFALLAAMLVAAAALPVRAEDDKKPATGEALKTAPTPAPAQQFCTVYVKELVAEPYTCTKTVYKTESKEEKYTAYKCVQVPVEKTRTVTVYKTVAETKPVTRKVVTCVPTVEERTTMQSHWVTHKVTVMEKKCVDKGHYECKEVPAGPSIGERIHHLTAKKSCGCEDACAPACDPCPRMKTVKCWVPCPTTIEVPKCKTERVCETKPVTCKVTVYKRVEKEETCNVTVNKCVAEQKTEKYTVCETKQVPYEATRIVTKCVPVQETVTGTRMVCKTVAKQVPVAPATCDPCAPTTCCKPKWFHFGH